MSKISIIVPIYKVEKYLARCVDSILAQTFKDYELILVDDGSPDNCPAMCDEYAEKYDFIKVIHKENGGLSDARNFGIDYAMTTESEWITFIDSDDWVHPQYLEILYNACTENNVDISSCGFERVKEFSGNKLSECICHIETVVDGIENLVEKKYRFEQFNISIACARLYKKSLWQEIRFPIGKLHEDEFTTYKVLFLTDCVAVVVSPLYYYYQNGQGIMALKNSLSKKEDRFEALFNQIVFFDERHEYGLSVRILKKIFKYIFTDLFYTEDKKIKSTMERQKRKLLLWIKRKNNRRQYHKAFKTVKKEMKNFFNSDIDSDFRVMKENKGVLVSIFYKFKKLYKLSKI